MGWQAKDIHDITALSAIDHHRTQAVEALRKIFPACPEKVFEAKFETLAKRGFTDYGVAVTRPWLTAKGKEELERLQQRLHESPPCMPGTQQDYPQ